MPKRQADAELDRLFQRTIARGGPAADRFLHRYRRRLENQDDEIYAIPDELINAIQAEIPRFFTKKELQFERDLNATVGGGLFLGSPFEHPGLPTRRLTDLEKQYFELADQRPVSLALEQITTDQLRAAGNSDDQVRCIARTQQKQSIALCERQIAYSGWLVTDAEFQRDRCQFLAHWHDKICERRAFPEVPRSPSR